MGKTVYCQTHGLLVSRELLKTRVGVLKGDGLHLGPVRLSWQDPAGRGRDP